MGVRILLGPPSSYKLKIYVSSETRVKKDNQDIVADIQKKLTSGIHIVFWLVLCLIEPEKELSMYEQSRIKISQLLSALVCLAIIAVEVL